MEFPKRKPIDREDVAVVRVQPVPKAGQRSFEDQLARGMIAQPQADPKLFVRATAALTGRV